MVVRWHHDTRGLVHRRHDWHSAIGGPTMANNTNVGRKHGWHRTNTTTVASSSTHNSPSTSGTIASTIAAVAILWPCWQALLV